MATGITDSVNYLAIAEAIRSGTRTASTYKPSMMASVIRNIRTFSDGVAIDYTITELVDASLTHVMGCRYRRNYYGAWPSNLSLVDLPNCTNVGISAFQGLWSLTSISLPRCVSICSYAFSGTGVTAVSLPACEIIREGAFEYCRNNLVIDLPVCRYVGSYAFEEHYSVSTFNVPVVEYIGEFGFCYAGNGYLWSLTLSKCRHIGSSAFNGLLSKIPQSVKDAYPRTYWEMSGTWSFPAVEYIGSSAFAHNSRLGIVDLTGVKSVPTLGSNAFSYTCITQENEETGEYGSVYVPKSLLASFKTATNWSSISARIVGV